MLPPDDTVDPVNQLLERCLQAPREEQDRLLAECCAAEPELAGPLRARYEALAAAGLLEPAAAPAALPRRFGEFVLLRELGRGGMGVVYLAEQPALQRQVALKLVRAEFLDQAKARERFRREIEAASGLEHPGICTVYAAGEVDGTPFIAMRHVAGTSLATRIAEARRSEAPPVGDEALATIALAEKIARALHFAHERGFIHRDVKPGNIMVDEDGEPVLLDFGLARPEESTGHSLTRTGDALGTPAYMSPEQISSTGRVIDRRTDVYSLAITLFEALTLRLPFEAPTLEELYRKILGTAAANATRYAPSLPRDLQIVLATAMDREAARRYRNAQEFAEDLRRIRNLEPITARHPPAWERAWRWARREPLKAALALVLALGIPSLGALGGYILAARDEVAAGEAALRRQTLDGILAAAFQATAQDRFTAARRHFAAAAAFAPGDVEAVAGHALSATADRRRGLFDSLQPDRAEVRRLRVSLPLIEVLQTQRRPDEASIARALAPIADLPAPQSASGHFIAGLVASQLGHRGLRRHYAEAYRHLLAATLTSTHAREHYHVALVQAGYYLKDRGRVLPCIEALVTLYPDSQAAQWTALWALCWFEPDRALQAAAEYRRRWPEDHSLLHSVGLIHEARGDLELAISTMGEGIGAASTPRQWHHWINLLRRGGKHDAARRAFGQMAEIHPEAAWTRAAAGVVAMLDGTLADARDAMAQAVELDPYEPQFRVFLGNALNAAGEPAAAHAQLKAALELDPEDDSALFWMACHLRDAGDKEAAAEHFRRAARVSRTPARALTSLARLQRKGGHLGAARESLDEAIRRQPGYTRAWLNLGLLLRECKDFEGSERAYRHAVRLDPDFAEAWCNLGQLLAWLWRSEEALAALRRGHDLGSARNDWPHPSAKWLAAVEARHARHQELVAMLAAGEAPLNSKNLSDLALLARFRGRWIEVVRVFEAWHTADPRLAHRSAAFRVRLLTTAAHAATHSGPCVPGTGLPGRASGEPAAEPERLRWMDLALELLEFELQAYRDAPAAGKAAALGMIRNCLNHDLFAVLREAAGRPRVPGGRQGRLEQVFGVMREALQAGR